MYKLSPSDFAYLWEDCKHCYYQKVKFGITQKSIFPSMFTYINKLLQGSIMGMNPKDILPELPNGAIDVQEGYIKSIEIPGTNCYISGRFDILTKLEDGTYGLIDFKITNPDEEKVLKKYSSQLQAYKFALENPVEKKPIKVSRMGAVTINPNEMKLVEGKVVFTATPKWHPIDENMESFFNLTKDISKLLEGPLPSVSKTCALCIYRKYFEPAAPILSVAAKEDIPF